MSHSVSVCSKRSSMFLYLPNTFRAVVCLCMVRCFVGVNRFNKKNVQPIGLNRSLLSRTHQQVVGISFIPTNPFTTSVHTRTSECFDPSTESLANSSIEVEIYRNKHTTITHHSTIETVINCFFSNGGGIVLSVGR